MSSLNRVSIIGRLGQDPEIKQVGQSQVANISVATTEKWKGKDGQNQERTEWHRIQFWGNLAGIIEKYLMKGSHVFIEGKIQTDSYEKNGVKMYATKIVGHELKFLSGTKDNRSGAYDNGAGFDGPQFDSSGEVPY